MAYTPYYNNGWQNNESGGTPITAAALNNMETGIGDNSTNIGTLSNLSTTAKTSLVAAINEVDADADTLSSNTLQRKGTLAGGADLQSFVTLGIYQLSGENAYSNLPSGVTWGTLIVFRPLTSTATFTVQMIVTSGAAVYIRLYIAGSGWTTWRSM